MPAPPETPRNRPLAGRSPLAACRGLQWPDLASGALVAACTAGVLLGDGWTPLAGYVTCMAGLAVLCAIDRR